jgi:serine/threonine-protein kinase
MSLVGRRLPWFAQRREVQGAARIMHQSPEMARRINARVGTTLVGKYRIDAVLGVGGMAVVYAVTHRNQAEFAIKMLHPELSLRASVRTRFLREGYSANSVKHPGAVRVVDDDVAEDGSAFLVMELLQGIAVDTLADRTRGRLSPQVAGGVVEQLLDVLSAAHARGIVHRDIKPANLFITTEGGVKVLDFGIARVREAAADPDMGPASTGTGVLLGTPAFMAPEQALAKRDEIDAQTDVWAAAATLFTLLSGEFVHSGDNAPQLLVAAATKPARQLVSVAPDVPRAIADVVDRGLAFWKPARYATALAMREALDDALRASYGEAPSRKLLVSLAATGAGTPTRVVASPLMHTGAATPTRVVAASPVAAVTASLPSDAPVASTESTSDQDPTEVRLSISDSRSDAKRATTSPPVSTPPEAEAPGLPRPSRTARRWIVGGALASVVVAGGATVIVRPHLSRSAVTATGAPGMLVPAVSAPPAASETAVPVAPVLPTEALAPLPATTPATLGLRNAAPRVTGVHPPKPARAQPAQSAASRAPFLSPPRPAPSCDPPFMVNSDGIRVPKPECL